MPPLIEVRRPSPDCWSDCGACTEDVISVQSVLVAPGDVVREYDALIVLETAKTALEVPSPCAGRVVDVYVGEHDPLEDGALIALIESG